MWLVDFFGYVVSGWTVILCFDWSVVYEMELFDWFLFLYSDWWMSDRLKYSYSVPLRTTWQMSQNFHASVGYCCPIWLVNVNNTRTRPMLITPSLNMVDAILLYVCTLSLSMSEWYQFALFSVFIGFWPRYCFKSDVAVVLSLWGSYSVL